MRPCHLILSLVVAASLSAPGAASAAGVTKGVRLPPLSGAPTKRSCFTDTSVEPPTHRVFTDTSGAPGWSTKLFMMRLTGFSVTRVTSVQKSSPAALPSEYFCR